MPASSGSKPPIPPPYDKVVADLHKLRQEGLTALQRLAPRALRQAAATADLDSGLADAPAIEALLRRAVRALGGDLGEAAAFTFGVAPGMKGAPSQERRRMAAEVYNLSAERFRRFQERIVIEQTAEEIIKLCHEQRQRIARMKLARRQHSDSGPGSAQSTYTV